MSRAAHHVRFFCRLLHIFDAVDSASITSPGLGEPCDARGRQLKLDLPFKLLLAKQSPGKQTFQHANWATAVRHNRARGPISFHKRGKYGI